MVGQKDEILNDIYNEISQRMQDMEKDHGHVEVPALARKMVEFPAAKHCDAYNELVWKSLSKRILRCQIFITNLNGNPGIIAFISGASKILQYFQKRKVSAYGEVGNNEYCKMISSKTM